MIASLCYVQCMMESTIMLAQATEAAIAATQAGSAETAGAPVWPLVAVLVLSLGLASRSRAEAPDDRR